MQRSVLVVRIALWLATFSLAAPALAGGRLPRASGTENDPVLAPEEITTTTSVGNPDGSRTVTTTDAEGNVLEQHTVPGDTPPGNTPPGNATLEDVQAEIERRAREDAEWLEGWDDEPGEPDGGGSGSAVPPPIDDWQRADDALIDMEEDLRDLRHQHNELLDRAGETEDPDAFDRLVEEAQEVFQEMNDLRDRYDDQRIARDRLAEDRSEPIDMAGMGAEIDRLEQRLADLPGEIYDAETDEEAEALEAEAAEAEARLRELREEYDGINDEVHQDALRRANERHIRATVPQGAVPHPRTPGPAHTPQMPQTPQIPQHPPHSHKSGY